MIRCDKVWLCLWIHIFMQAWCSEYYVFCKLYALCHASFIICNHDIFMQVVSWCLWCKTLSEYGSIMQTCYASMWVLMQVMYMLICMFSILCKYMNAYASMWVLMQVKYMLKCKFYMLCKSHVWWYVSSYLTCYANHMFDDM